MARHGRVLKLHTVGATARRGGPTATASTAAAQRGRRPGGFARAGRLNERSSGIRAAAPWTRDDPDGVGRSEPDDLPGGSIDARQAGWLLRRRLPRSAIGRSRAFGRRRSARCARCRRGIGSRRRKHPASAERCGRVEPIDVNPARRGSMLLVAAPHGGYIDLHNYRPREWRPAQVAAAIDSVRRPYDLRHAYATFALRAGISNFDPVHGREPGDDRQALRPPRARRTRHAVELLDGYARDTAAWTQMDAPVAGKSADRHGSEPSLKQ